MEYCNNWKGPIFTKNFLKDSFLDQPKWPKRIAGITACSICYFVDLVEGIKGLIDSLKLHKSITNEEREELNKRFNGHNNVKLDFYKKNYAARSSAIDTSVIKDDLLDYNTPVFGRSQ